ncbi:SDR family oxidoreductase [Mycobacterium sp. AT1]|uniref:SDR family oxidoreductase n=1 Tax=Mycobacterium sp. AT1 TaxID=1961706 RepID=UPI0009AEDA09|nr:SDR family oxidoreductase [Mycobacterium sp. AT1]OPX05911.1 hypothetical protein B1790_30070 [Mycobacterium sp. AT1]
MTTLEEERPTALVTGASGYLGRAIARRLAHDGFAVVAQYSSNRQSAEALVDAIVRGGGAAISVQADVTDSDSFSSAFEHGRQVFGGIDVLVNSAGVATSGLLAAAGEEDFQEILGVSALGTFHGIRFAAAGMRDNGRVVNLSTTSVAVTTPGMGLYMAAKAAVETLTRSAAKELATRGITVNAVAPGAIESPMFARGKTDQQIAEFTRSHPAGRLGDADDVAAAVALLVSQDAAWISGQVVRVNGGVA